MGAYDNRVYRIRGLYFIYFVKIAVDIAAIDVAANDDCADEHGEGNLQFLGSDTPTTWMLVGGIADLASACFACVVERINYKKGGGNMGGWMCYSYPIAMLHLIISCLFMIIWISYGFLFASSISTDDSCATMVMSWCIIQCIPTFLSICMIGLLCFEGYFQCDRK